MLFILWLDDSFIIKVVHFAYFLQKLEIQSKLHRKKTLAAYTFGLAAHITSVASLEQWYSIFSLKNRTPFRLTFQSQVMSFIDPFTSRKEQNTDLLNPKNAFGQLWNAKTHKLFWNNGINVN